MRYLRFRYRHRASPRSPRSTSARASASSASTSGVTRALASRAASASRRWSERRSSRCRWATSTAGSGRTRSCTRTATSSIEGDYYSAPHIHRHKKLRVKITENQVEIFLDLERLAIHPRSRHKNGRRIKIDAHFPPNTAGVLRGDATEAALAITLHPSRTQSACSWSCSTPTSTAHLRRCPGPRARLHQRDQPAGHELASERIVAAIASMRRYNKLPRAVLPGTARRKRANRPYPPESDREIVRRPGNPMLRYAGGAVQAADVDAAVPVPQQPGEL